MQKSPTSNSAILLFGALLLPIIVGLSRNNSYIAYFISSYAVFFMLFILGIIVLISIMRLFIHIWQKFHETQLNRIQHSKSGATKNENDPNYLLKFLASVALVLLMQTLSIPIAEYSTKRDHHKAIEYCEQFIPQINAYFEAHNYYPQSIETFQRPNKPLPFLIQYSSNPFSESKFSPLTCNYAPSTSNDSDSYTLWFPDYNSVKATIWTYDSHKQKWSSSCMC